jgi:hypothetical protein
MFEKYREYAWELTHAFPDIVLYKYRGFLERKYLGYKKRKELVNKKIKVLELIYKKKRMVKEVSVYSGVSPSYISQIDRYFLAIVGYRFLNGLWRLDRMEEVK